MVVVTVWFAGTLVQVTRVARGRVLRVGRGCADLELDVAPMAIDTRLEHDLAIGLVRITVTHVAAAPPLAKRASEKRPLPFIAVSLAAHLAVVLIAMATIELEPVTITVDITSPPRLPPRVARIEPRPIERPMPAAIAPAPAAATTAATAPPGASGGERVDGWARLSKDLGKLMGTADLAKELADTGPLYNPDIAPDGQFGGGRSFDVSDREEFASVKTGPYATIGGGRGAGAHYKLPGEVDRPPLMALACDDDTSCVVEGTLNRHVVRDIIEKRYVDLLKCYERTANTAPRVEITMRFEIRDDGHVDELAIDGHPIVGNCVRRIVARTRFPAEHPTRVKTYPMAFWRT